MPAEGHQPRTAAELIDRVQIDWAALEYVLSGLSEAQWTTPGPEGWSVKDHLAHIADWERMLVAVLGRRPEHEGFGLPPPLPEDIDVLNDILYRRSRGLSIEEVQDVSRRAHAEVLAALHHLSDADLRTSVAGYGGDPGDDRPLLDKIAANTYAHYAEHTGWINDLLRSR